MWLNIEWYNMVQSYTMIWYKYKITQHCGENPDFRSLSRSGVGKDQKTGVPFGRQIWLAGQSLNPTIDHPERPEMAGRSALFLFGFLQTDIWYRTIALAWRRSWECQSFGHSSQPIKMRKCHQETTKIRVGKVLWCLLTVPSGRQTWQRCEVELPFYHGENVHISDLLNSN